MVVLSVCLVALKIWRKKEMCTGQIPLQFSLTVPPVSLWRGPGHFSFRTKLFLLSAKYELNSLFLLKMCSCYKSSMTKIRFQKRCIYVRRRKEEIPVSILSLLLAPYVGWHIPCCCTSFFCAPASHSSLIAKLPLVSTWQEGLVSFAAAGVTISLKLCHHTIKQVQSSVFPHPVISHTSLVSVYLNFCPSICFSWVPVTGAV